MATKSQKGDYLGSHLEKPDAIFAHQGPPGVNEPCEWDYGFAALMQVSTSGIT
jgi:hypothetical protein